MGLTENLVQAKSELDALLTFANEKTGASDATLGDAVKTLADGFGQGGSSGVTYTEVTKLLEGRSFSKVAPVQ